MTTGLGKSSFPLSNRMDSLICTAVALPDMPIELMYKRRLLKCFLCGKWLHHGMNYITKKPVFGDPYVLCEPCRFAETRKDVTLEKLGA